MTQREPTFDFPSASEGSGEGRSPVVKMESSVEPLPRTRSLLRREIELFLLAGETPVWSKLKQTKKGSTGAIRSTLSKILAKRLALAVAAREALQAAFYVRNCR